MVFLNGSDLRGSFSTRILYFWLANKESCQEMGSFAYENNVIHLYRRGWKQNHSENSQMASTNCMALAPSIFVLLFFQISATMAWETFHDTELS
jgi:hypothetical protein